MHAGILAISSRIGPPRTDLRDARLQDDFGSETSAKIPIDHQRPEDVQDHELEYYHDVWAFLELPDLVFYLHPVVSWFSRNPGTALVLFDFFVWSLDRCWGDAERWLTAAESRAIVDQLLAMKDSQPRLEGTYEQCRLLFAARA